MKLLSDFYLLQYYILLQFRTIFPYWFAGVIIGSFVSVFASGMLYKITNKLNGNRFPFLVIVLAAFLGAASPICMYGTIPLIASIGKKGIPQHILAAFMVSSILINPNLFILSFALGAPLAIIRLFICLLAGIFAGILVKLFFKNKVLFNFEGFEDRKKRKINTPGVKIFFSDLNRGISKTAPYFIIGILLTALFQIYVPSTLLTKLFLGNGRFGVLVASMLGVPIYVCGGGAIPLLKYFLDNGMSSGAAVAFMLSGASTKLTNLSAVKIILGIKNFAFYIVFNIAFSILAGITVDLLYSIIK